jgi:two-component system chemotaxis sensor kinase CheA
VTLTGHEEEFRRLFEQEAGTRLSTLAEGAMELESAGEDPRLVTEMFRAAHTLKGGAAVVGFADVAAVVHELEQILEELRSGARRADAALVDGVLATVDAVRAMVDQAMVGADASGSAAAARAAIAAARGGRRTARPGDADRAEASEPSGTEGVGSAPRLDADATETATPAGTEDAAPADPATAAADTAAAAADDDGADAATPPGTEAVAPAEAPTSADPAPHAPSSEPPDEPAPHAESSNAAVDPDAADRLLPARRVVEPLGPGAAAGPRGGADAIPVPVGRLDELVRLVGESGAALLRVGRLLHERVGQDPAAVDEYRELARVLQDLQESTMRARMVSVATVAAPLRRAVRDIARASGKQIRWELVGEDTELDRHVLEHLREPLVALVRNAADHGVEPPAERAARGKPEQALVRVHAMQIGADVVIAVGDDGRGIDVDRVRASAGRTLSDADALSAIFEPGLTTAEQLSGVSGRGVGLDAVRSAVDALRGRVEVRTEPGRGTEFRVSVPVTLAALRCLLVRVGDARYAVPMHSTATALPAPDGALVTVEGRPAVLLEGDAVGFVRLADVLGVPTAAANGRRAAPTAVVLATASGRHAFGVDELLGRRDIVVKDLGRLLPRLPLVAGASVEPDGGIMLVLDPDGLIAAARGAPRRAVTGHGGGAAPAHPSARLLVVDDALTIRELERSILARAGYDVATAPDAEAALRSLAERPAELVVCDVEMPGMDGFALTRAIRAMPEHAAVPILILTSRGDEADRRAGMEAGADAYLVKSRFDEHTLLTAVRRLLGEDADA